MTSLDRPAPPPTLDSIAALIDNLDELLKLDGSQEGLAEGPYNQALDNLRAIAAACDINWDNVLDEHDRRAVVAE